jgi:hypothetical protein
MQKIIKNEWRCKTGEPFAHARILSHDIHPEGLDVDRMRFLKDGSFIPESSFGHIISVLHGSGRIQLDDNNKKFYQLEKGVHLYIPPGMDILIEANTGTELIKVSGPSSTQTRGKKFILRNEIFLSACASVAQPLRWILTPQYLSRRIFLHHDPVLLSKSGNPVSWFHTTMFDVTGLPDNENGVPVFKMSYNSRTEFNVCYKVKGTARVRMAEHPYRKLNQCWGSWLALDGESTYHLNEAAGCPEEERDVLTQTRQTLRNKHEVQIVDGHVSLLCLFDPAPTGLERHRPGEYSDYEPLSEVIKSGALETYQREITRYDEMVDQLSLAKALGKLNTLQGTPIWDLFLQGREAQISYETKLSDTLTMEGKGREQVLAPWMLTSFSPVDL